MPAQEPSDFDAAAIAKQLVGTWAYFSPLEFVGIGYVHFTKDGRVITPLFDGSRWIPGRFRYSVESADNLRVIPPKSEEGWLAPYRLDGDFLKIGVDCWRVAPDEVPGWLLEIVGAALQKPF